MSTLIGIPMERNISQAAFCAFLSVARRGHEMHAGSYGPTHWARNVLVREFLETEFTHLLMLDSDMVHPPDIVERLERWLTAPEKPQIVGALYFRRGAPYDPCAYVDDRNGLEHIADWPTGLVSVDAIGTGAILIARQVFDIVPYPWFEYEERGAGLVTEDIVFCRKARAANIAVWVDTTTVIPHIGDTWITEATSRAYLKHIGGAAGVVTRTVETDILGGL